MLTDNENTKHLTPKRRRIKDKQHWYSDSQKLEAVKLWLVIGNLSQVAATLDIPLPTLRTWRYSKWWDEVSKEIRAENRVQLSTRLKTIAAKALDVTMDRLENGDFFLNKITGSVDRKPVAMRDAYLVAAGTLDRQVKLEEKPQEEVNKQVEDRLKALAETFAKFTKKVKRIEVIDAEYTGQADSPIEIEGEFKRSADGGEIIEQSGDNGGEQVDGIREDTELDDSGGEGQGPSSEAGEPLSSGLFLQPKN